MKVIARLIAALPLLLVTHANAAVTTQSLSFDLSAPVILGSSGAGDVLLFNRFDTSLGTLDSVDVRILGGMQLSAVLPANLIPQPPGVPLPAPYTYSFNLKQTLGGLPFLNDPQILLNGTATGTSLALVAAYTYDYAFSFDAASDLPGFASVATSDVLTSSLGVASAIPPGLAFGQRDDFTADFPGVPLLVSPTLSAEGLLSGYTGSGGPLAGTLHSGGTIMLSYNYTAPIVTVPEPSSMALFAFGFGGLALLRRRRPRG